MKSGMEGFGKKKRILVIEPSGEESAACRDRLETEFELIFEPDAGKAVALLQKREPDAIVLNDACEGERDGLCVLKAIRAAAQRVPVIFLTGTGYFNDSYQAMRSGADSYVLKPFRGAELSQTIHKVIKKKRRWTGLIRFGR